MQSEGCLVQLIINTLNNTYFRDETAADPTSVFIIMLCNNIYLGLENRMSSRRELGTSSPQP